MKATPTEILYIISSLFQQHGNLTLLSRTCVFGRTIEVKIRHQISRVLSFLLTYKFAIKMILFGSLYVELY